MDPLKQRFLQELMQHMAAGQGADLKARYADPSSQEKADEADRLAGVKPAVPSDRALLAPLVPTHPAAPAEVEHRLNADAYNKFDPESADKKLNSALDEKIRQAMEEGVLDQDPTKTGKEEDEEE